MAVSYVLVALFINVSLITLPGVEAFINFHDIRRLRPIPSPIRAASMDYEALIEQAARLRGEAAAAERDLVAAVTSKLEKQLRQQFEALDTNDDGVLELSELEHGLRGANGGTVPLDFVEQSLARMDVNSDGVLSLEEWMCAAMPGEGDILSVLRRQLRERQRSEAEAARALENEAEAADTAAQRRDDTYLARTYACAPFLMPVMDALCLARPAAASLPEVCTALAPLFEIAHAYQATPFLPLLWWLGVSRKGENMNLSLVVRYNAKQAMILDLFVLLVPATADLTLGRFDNAAGGAIAVAVGFAVASAVCTTIETGGRSDNLGPLSWLTYEWMVRSFEDEARRRNEKGNERD